MKASNVFLNESRSAGVAQSGPARLPASHSQQRPLASEKPPGGWGALEPLEPRLLLSVIPPYFVGEIDLNTGTGTGPDGVVRILGDDAGDWSGYSVSSAGDVNGDGYDDFVIGAREADPAGGDSAGETYLVFGHDGAWSDINLNTGTGTGPVGVVRILGDDARDVSGHSVSSAGDVNGDGYDDFLIGALYADPAGGKSAGETYLVFGHGGAWSDIDLNTGTGTGPVGVVRILGDDFADFNGCSVSSAGDVNGDGYDDFVIGAPQGGPEGAPWRGWTYLVFGHGGAWSDIDFNAEVPSSTAIRILGDDDWDRSGQSVSSAGDVNGDGYDDFLIGAYRAFPAGGYRAGETYLVFGHGGAWSDIDFSAAVLPSTAIRIFGHGHRAESGISVSSAGNVNGDAYDDFLIGAWQASPAGGYWAGETYLVFGHGGAWSDIDLNTGTGTGPDGVVRILGDDGGDRSGHSVSSAGDVNGDAYDDFLIGAHVADPAGGTYAGET